MGATGPLKENGTFHEVPIPNDLVNNNNNDSDDTKTKPDGASQVKNRTFQSALPQILASSAKNMLLFSYGTSLGLPTIAIPVLSSLQEDTRDPYLTLNRSQISWFSSINLICVPLGCLVSGALTQPFGRKRSMMFMNIPYTIAFLLFILSRDVTTLYVALALCGLTGGLMEAPVLTYVAEITEPHLRGMLSAVASMAVLFGQVSQLLLGSFLHWRTVATINIAFPVISTVILYFIPESPHWLITKGRITDAEASLCWLRGWVTPDKVQTELKQITKAIEDSALTRLGKDGQKRPNYRMYTRRTFLLPYAIVTLTFFIGAFGGLTPLLTYAVSIFESLNTPINPYIATLFLGVAEIFGAFLCVILIHYTGKRPLAIISTGGAGLCFFVVAVYAQFHQSHGWDAPVIPLVFLLGFGFVTYLCIRLLPWMLIGEVFPNNIRSTASGAAASSSYVFGFLINKLYFPMKDLFDLHGLLYFYASVNILGMGLLYVFMPETESRTLSDIARHFADKTKTFDTTIVRSDKMKPGDRDAAGKVGVENMALETRDEKY
uniref:Facilitated trehalose transporter Tret1 n=1 Tax=Cacopsylla melanoneura TaxID=428564 RepID=A0A8D8YEB3_9HEMI